LIGSAVTSSISPTSHIGKSAFAMKIGVYPSHFSDILKGKRRLNASIALKLERGLGIFAEF
jgi:plasmid maintenance system antidote protein VapI